MTPERARLERLPPDERHELPDPRRAPAAEVERQVALVRDSPIVAALLDAVDAVLLVLNRERQVVASNGPRRDAERSLGKRTGEVLGCVHGQGPSGCGTSAECERCGALGAILGCEGSRGPVGAECVISTVAGATVELDVRATPVALEGERFTVVTLRDVTVEKRREALEQILFHDLLNTASGLRGLAWHLGRPGVDLRRTGERIDLLSRQLVREIQDHRSLVLAEEGALVPTATPLFVARLTEEVTALLSQHDLARERALETRGADGLAVETDRTLVVRVLVNMVRNALEATPPGGTVRVLCEDDGSGTGGVRLSVHNAQAMEPDVQARVFQRSFSTKGRGRGLGTYGMKLIGERYLGGEVSFTSSPEAGTTFSIRLPARLPAPAPAR
jgi:K+-sensing histidine kinase KdpD